MAISPSAAPVPDLVPLRRALISVFDKAGVVGFAAALAARGVEILSTGGTRAALTAAGIATRDVSEATGFPEIMDGRVKTLHPAIHGGLLGVRDDPAHAAAMHEHGIAGIDLLVVNLYPFEETAASGRDTRTIVENVDIGGPAMIRAGAKNHAYVAVAVDPSDYEAILAALDANGGATTLDLRRRLAGKAFARTASYDAAIAGWFAGAEGEAVPEWLTFPAGWRRRSATARTRTSPPRSTSAARAVRASPPRASSRARSSPTTTSPTPTRRWNSPPSSIPAPPLRSSSSSTPTRAASRSPRPWSRPTARRSAAIRSPRSAASSPPIARSMRTRRARSPRCSPRSSLRPRPTKRQSPFSAQKKNLRLLLTGTLPDPRANGLTARTVSGGLLVQGRDSGAIAAADLKVVTKRAPAPAEMADLLFAWTVAKHVKSNAIVYAKDGATAGIGAGQMSRLDSALIAARKAEEAARAAGIEGSLARGGVCASDAFFPFADGLIAAADAGVTAVIQPGGSMRDDEVIAAADERGLAMVSPGCATSGTELCPFRSLRYCITRNNC
jgi:phosphoribosylaminoimidazolecarboxamide formyltransferase / IMP cyclohydrolase